MNKDPEAIKEKIENLTTEIKKLCHKKKAK